MTAAIRGRAGRPQRRTPAVRPTLGHTSRVGQVRASLGLSRPKFAGLLGVHLATIVRWECSDNEPTGLERVVLEALETRAARGEREELRALAVLATTDLPSAMRRLLEGT